ncbi:molecular chaperone DnaK [Neokomagataea thailandica NBRC 106555]|uniref:Molecular chaperone DnaK n=1 Tax=Neokomagataea thailandica NBRC 106555 TaxID=1223520 RepID=A0ABQ0QQ36_9PROT|nr:molecular chaperone DnaK [Neokomagataea thailandica NBRC 106555]
MIVLSTGDDVQPVTLRFSTGESRQTCRTLLCLWHETEGSRRVLSEAIGQDAIEAYLDDPAESRLIMSMKSYLAQASFQETRLFGKTMRLEDLIARFLRALMDKAGYAPESTSVTIGRPVRFAGERANDALGVSRLEQSFMAAGFPKPHIVPEPEGAGWRFMQRLDRASTILVGDFGGGTSDFSIMRFDPAEEERVQTLGHSGVGIAGDQFDARIIEHVVAPALGRNATYRVMGGAALPVPPEWFLDLGRWHRLSMMRTPQTLRSIEDVAKTSSAPDALRHLYRLIDDQAGQGLHRAVSEAKAALSHHDQTTLSFAHGQFKLDATINRTEFEQWIAPDLARMDAAIAQALSEAGNPTIDRVFLTGGTSFVPAVRALFSRRFGNDKIDSGSEFVSVAEGLALIEAGRKAA